VPADDERDDSRSLMARRHAPPSGRRLELDDRLRVLKRLPSGGREAHLGESARPIRWLTRVYVVEMSRTGPFQRQEAPARSESPDRLGSLYESHNHAATRLAYVLTGDVDAAQDIAQEAFVRVGRRLLALRDPQHSNAYLYRTVVNLCRGRARRLKIERAAMQVLKSDQCYEAPDITEQDEMWRALLLLPVRQRAALFLRYYQDLSEAQTAEVLQCSLSTVKSLVNRGLKELRVRFEGVGDD
jgi:RNA polymerase sigma factor (sigma-70 family)